MKGALLLGAALGAGVFVGGCQCPDKSKSADAAHAAKCAECTRGKAGEAVWCEACGHGFVGGQTVACKGCFAAKTGGPPCEACAAKK